MADKYGNTRAVGVQFNLRIQNLFGFRRHFPFFFGRAVVHKNVNMRNNVKRNLFGEFVLRLGQFFAPINALCLIKQFVHCRFARAGYGLIRRYDHARDMKRFVQRSQRNDHLNRRTVRVGNNVFLFIIRNRFGVDFGHDQRNVGIHAPLR